MTQPTLPHSKATIALSFLTVILAFSLTVYVIHKGLVKDEALGLILSAWLTGGLGAVYGFWLQSSVGGRLRSTEHNNDGEPK